MKLDKEIIDVIAKLSPIEVLSDALFLHTRDYEKYIAESNVPSIIQNKNWRIRKLARMKVLLAALIRQEVIDKNYKTMFDNETADAQKEFRLVAQNIVSKDDVGNCESKDDAEG